MFVSVVIEIKSPCLFCVFANIFVLYANVLNEGYDAFPRRQLAATERDTPNFPSKSPQNRFKPFRGILYHPNPRNALRSALKRKIKIQRILSHVQTCSRPDDLNDMFLLFISIFLIIYIFNTSFYSL